VGVRNEQRPAGEPQKRDDPIDNEPKAPYDNGIVPHEDDLADSAEALSSETMAEPQDATVPSWAEQDQAAPMRGSADSQPPAAPTPEDSTGGLIIQPSGVEVRRLRPQVTLHIHLSQETLASHQDGTSRFGGGVGRFEGVGPVALGQVRRFLADTGCDVRVQPVIDPANSTPVDSYEIPRRIREAMFLRMPASCFPYATTTGRLELDHTKAYRPPTRGGPPGQTGIHGLGPLIRFEHRVKTHGRCRCDNQNPESGSGDHPTAPTIWSPTPAPTISATRPLHVGSGVPQHPPDSRP